MTLVRQIAPEIKNHRGSLAVLRMRPSRLALAQKLRLGELFKTYPAIEPIYDQMQALCELRLFIKDWGQEVKMKNGPHVPHT